MKSEKQNLAQYPHWNSTKMLEIMIIKTQNFRNIKHNLYKYVFAAYTVALHNNVISNWLK